MSMQQPDLTALREVMTAFPALEAHTPIQEIAPDDIYFPRAHAAALNLDRSLVIGNRGMGKSYWAKALVGRDTRARIAAALPGSRLAEGQVEIEYGFAEGEGNVGVSRDALQPLLASGASAESIWRAVTLREIAKQANRNISPSLSERLHWVMNDPEAVRDLLRSADHALTNRQCRLVFVFDQLEQLSDDIEGRRQLIQGVLRLALAYKSYRNLRLKIFMRPDQAADDRIFQFPDSSKISGERVDLDWRAIDLYGLLYARLRAGAQDAFDRVATRAAIDQRQLDSLTYLPRALVEDADMQHAFFDLLAGKYMGTNPRRGFTYTWLTLHLADARNQVSPRTFLRAIKYAADHQPSPNDTVIDYKGIHAGVDYAAKNRVDDLKEDYPWVPPALHRLTGLSVPCDPHQLIERWHTPSSILSELKEATPGDKMPEWLASSRPDELAAHWALLSAMATVGVIEVRRSTSKVDIPDIFRLPDDIRRRGGVTPQQRRNARLG